MNAVQIAAQLYTMRDTARNLLGARYAGKMAEHATAIRAVADDQQCSELRAAQLMVKAAGSEYGTIIVLAAFVEMTEPSQAAPTCA